ncbi:MAG: hypothetical protein PUJ09_04320 [Eubacteriales bacterium]|nr:hypothetical protein [Eubacteriales bacterium]
MFLEDSARFELSQFRLAKLMILRRRAAGKRPRRTRPQNGVQNLSVPGEEHSKNARLFLEDAARFELSQFHLAKLMILRRRAAIEADV